MLKSKLFIYFILLLASKFAFGQQDWRWLLGYASGGGPQFGGTDMIFGQNQLDSINYHYRGMWFEFANASICNDSGKLLFYTNGVYIANAQDDTMLNGSGLNPSFYTSNWYQEGLRIPQADIIIPKPGDTSLYYLFHETNNYGTPLYRPAFLYQSIIDMQDDSGRGAVILKNHPIIADTLVSGSLTACKHANGRDWWLLVPEWGTDAGFYTVLITADTVEVMNYQKYSINGLEGGQACFSPDGSKYVWSNWVGMAFFDFDRCSGALTLDDYFEFTDSVNWLGTSISPNSRYCYLSHGYDLYQYDLQATNIPSSQITVAQWDTFYDPNPPFATVFWMHQIAPDGKIYISHGNSTMSFHVIDQPDNGGISCNVMQHSVALPHFNVTIPNFPNYNLGALTGSVCDTLTGIADFGPDASGVNADLGVRLFPNPNNGTFMISYRLPQNKEGMFEVFDVNGRRIYSQVLPKWSTVQYISLPEAADGVYYGVITSDGYRACTKLVMIN